MVIIDELLVGLGFDYDPTETQRFTDDITKTVGVIKNLAKFAIGAATAITGMTITSSRASDEVGKLADEIGDTVENVSALQFAQQIAGGSADGMANSLRELSLRASEAARGTGSGVEAFGLLGISVTNANGGIKDTSNLLQEVSGRMQGLGRARQIELADKLGLRDSIRLLQGGPRAIRELITEAKSLGVVTGQDAAISADFNDTLLKFWTITKQVTRVLTRTFAPIMDDLVTQFTDWWKINKDIIEQNIPKWIDGFTSALKVLTLAMGAFIAVRVITHLMQMISLMRGVTLAALAMNVGIFLLPALIASVATAIALLAEDAKVFFEGGDSFIGDMIEKYPQWESQIRTIAGIFNGIAEVTTMIFEGWSKIFGLFDEGGGDAMNQALKDKGLGFLTKEIGVTGEQGGVINDFLSDIGAGFLTREIGLFESGTLDTPLTSQTKTSTIIEKLEILVNGGNDSARNIGDEIYRVFQQTSQDLNSTVDQ